jgi:hypothetical protein
LRPQAPTAASTGFINARAKLEPGRSLRVYCERLVNFRWVLLAAFPFAAYAETPALKCTFQPIRSTLTFSLRYEAGYTLQFSKGEFTGAKHTLEIALKVTSLTNAREPFLVSNRSTISATGPFEISNHFRLGPGSWHMEASAADDGGRVCRGDWKVDLKDAFPAASAHKLQSKGRITVLLDATPVGNRSVTLVPDDVSLLTGTVSYLTRNTAATSLRLVVINLDAQKEFLRLEPYTRADFPKLRATLSALPIATVDYRSLKKDVEADAFLATLLARETEDQTDVVIFLGPQSRNHKPIKANAIKNPPVCYYLEYRQPVRVVDVGTQPEESPNGIPKSNPIARDGALDLSRDTIERLMQKVHGRTIIFFGPVDFARALDRIAVARSN